MSEFTPDPESIESVLLFDTVRTLFEENDPAVVIGKHTERLLAGSYIKDEELQYTVVFRTHEVTDAGQQYAMILIDHETHSPLFLTLLPHRAMTMQDEIPLEPDTVRLLRKIAQNSEYTAESSDRFLRDIRKGLS